VNGSAKNPHRLLRKKDKSMDPASVSRCPEWSNPVRGVVYGILGTASVQPVMAGIGFIGVFIGPTLLAVG
jgi:hypothetical protein